MENKLPLGICKQAVLKYESALNDINEILEDINDSEQKEVFGVIAELTGNIISHIYNQVSAEMDEEEFIAEQIEMDEIGNWPGEKDNIMDEIM